jgi:hypothetical protein
MQAAGLGREKIVDMFDSYILTTLKLDRNGNVISTNVAVTFDIHDAEAHRDKSVENDFETFAVSDNWREDAEQSNLVKAMREFREMVRQWQEEALR